MDKSVAQKFAIIMSMFVAVFATVFVCGNIVNDGFTSDSYVTTLAKTGNTVSYSDKSIDDVVSYSDLYDNQNVVIVEFIDDEEVEPIITSAQNVDEDYLYMTTVTTTGSLTERSTTAAAATTRKTTAIKPATSTTAKPTVSKSTTTTTTTTTAITTVTTQKSTTASDATTVRSTTESTTATTHQVTTASTVTTFASTIPASSVSEESESAEQNLT